MASNNYVISNIDLGREFANVIKKICTDKLAVNKKKEETYLEALLASGLVPLNKNPGVRPVPVGVDEVLRKIAEKAVMKTAKEDITK